MWWDSALQGTAAYKPDTGSSTTYTTTYTYNGFAQLTSIGVADGRPRTVTFRNSADGQAIRRDEADNLSGGDPHEVYYRLGGKQLGKTGNNGTADVSYLDSTARRTATQGTGAFQGGLTYGSAYADFGLDYDAINSFSQGSDGGLYEVQAGDTLQGIAQSLWGDASLWYKLAEANGLGATSTLSAGRSLILPAGVQRVHNNASTFKPYDPAEVIGDTSPTTPKPAKKNKCGTFGQVLVAVIAIAVAIALPHLIPALGPSALGGGILGGAASGAIGGAVGSAVSQGVGLASGIQQKFDFKGVALSALGGAVGGGLGGSGVFGKTVDGAFKAGSIGIKSGVINAAVQGMAASALTQGIAVATGLQSKFSWAGVAAAGVGAGVGFEVGSRLGGSFGGQLAANTASAIANAATRSAIEGSNFGNNLVAAIPDVIGQAIGSAIAGAASGGGSSAAKVAGSQGGKKVYATIDALQKRAVGSPVSNNGGMDTAGEAAAGTVKILAGAGGSAGSGGGGQSGQAGADMASDPLNLSYAIDATMPAARTMLDPQSGPGSFYGWIDDLDNKWGIGWSSAPENVQLAVDTLWNGLASGDDSWNLVSNALTARGLSDALPEGLLAVASGLSDHQAKWASENPILAFGFAAGRFSTGAVSSVASPIYRLGGNVIYGSIGALSGTQISDFSLANLYDPVLATGGYGWSAVTGQTNVISDASGLYGAGSSFVSNYYSGFTADRAQYGTGYALSARASDLGVVTGSIGSLALGGEFALGGRAAAVGEFSVAGRVSELQAMIPVNSRGRITMGVGVAQDAGGAQRILIGTSEPNGYLRPGVTLNPGETIAPGLGHAEVDIVRYAQQNNLRLLEVGATRPVCLSCVPVLEGAGVRIVTPIRGR